MPCLVPLADDAWPIRFAVEDAGGLVFENGLLLLEEQQLGLTGGERLEAFGLERPDTSDLVDRQTQCRGAITVDPQQPEGLHHVVIGLARGDDSQRPVRTVEGDSVDAVCAHEPVHQRNPVSDDVGLGLQGKRKFTVENVQRIQRRVTTVRQRHLEIVHRNVDGRGLFDGLVDGLEPHPQTGVTGQRPAQQTELDVLLDTGRIERGDGVRGQGEFALVGNRRGLARVVIAVDHEDAAVGVSTSVVAVLHRVTRAVDPRPFSVPDGENTDDPVVIELRLCLPQRRVVPTDG
jgi:hypothetical protein